jgi:hypothetical protein
VGQGGGLDPSRVDEAFESLQGYVREQLSRS